MWRTPEAYREQFGDRVTVVVIERASHAVVAEQPDAVSAALIALCGQALDRNRDIAAAK